LQFSFQRTLEKNFENGKPLSRENAQTSRETDAKMLNSATNMMITGIRVKKVAAGFDFVAR
jgi:hypothetical protein